VAATSLNKRFDKLFENEAYEPLLTWGFRMAISAMGPLLWGLITNHVQDAIWMTLTAEAVCWVELKGPFSWQLRTLLTGTGLAIIFAILGAVTGTNVWLSTIAMLGTAFLATLLKNIGDRASGLAICTYLLFILSNAYPTASVPELEHRIKMIMVGAVYTIAIGTISSLVKPTEQPFRRYIALIWRSIAELITTVSKGWDGHDKRNNIRGIYLSERNVRTAMDNSFQFYESMTHQANSKEKQQFQLVQLRKTAALVAVHVISMSEETEKLPTRFADQFLRSKWHSLFTALHDTVDRMGIYIITLKPEEKLLVQSRLERLKNLVVQVKQYPLPQDEAQAKPLQKIVHLTERTIKLIERAMALVDEMGKDLPLFRSYSLFKTLYILHPQFIFKNLRLLFNFNTFTTRYALRSAIAAGLALFIYKFFNINHGYWLPFSVMIVIQPYFGATLKKALERIIGTLTGGLTGSLCLLFPQGLHIKEMVLFATFVGMVYYLRRNYAIAAFFITLNVVLLFNIESALQPMLIIIRAVCTIGGAGLAVASGFLLLPVWDKKWLPSHLVRAIEGNYKYFIKTFYTATPQQAWTRCKRDAETANSNVFDSFNRYLQEPTEKENSTLYYSLITTNIRITRYLNNIQTELEERAQHQPVTDEQQQRIDECFLWFNRNLQLLAALQPEASEAIMEKSNERTVFRLNDTQQVFVDKVLVELKTMHQDIEKFTGKQHIE
jgi:uncharacterized membrane protein YccC